MTGSPPTGIRKVFWFCMPVLCVERSHVYVRLTVFCRRLDVGYGTNIFWSGQLTLEGLLGHSAVATAAGGCHCDGAHHGYPYLFCPTLTLFSMSVSVCLCPRSALCQSGRSAVGSDARAEIAAIKSWINQAKHH